MMKVTLGTVAALDLAGRTSARNYDSEVMMGDTINVSVFAASDIDPSPVAQRIARIAERKPYAS